MHLLDPVNYSTFGICALNMVGRIMECTMRHCISSQTTHNMDIANYNHMFTFGTGRLVGLYLLWAHHKSHHGSPHMDNLWDQANPQWNTIFPHFTWASVSVSTNELQVLCSCDCRKAFKEKGFKCTGGIMASEAISLLRSFYDQGNPNGIFSCRISYMQVP